MPLPAQPHQRLADTRQRLEQDIDAWVATAHPDGGAPGLVPLSFDWDGPLMRRGVWVDDGTGTGSPPPPR